MYARPRHHTDQTVRRTRAPWLIEKKRKGCDTKPRKASLSRRYSCARVAFRYDGRASRVSADVISCTHLSPRTADTTATSERSSPPDGWDTSRFRRPAEMESERRAEGIPVSGQDEYTCAERGDRNARLRQLSFTLFRPTYKAYAQISTKRAHTCVAFVRCDDRAHSVNALAYTHGCANDVLGIRGPFLLFDPPRALLGR